MEYPPSGKKFNRTLTFFSNIRIKHYHHWIFRFQDKCFTPNIWTCSACSFAFVNLELNVHKNCKGIPSNITCSYVEAKWKSEHTMVAPCWYMVKQDGMMFSSGASDTSVKGYVRYAHFALHWNDFFLSTFSLVAKPCRLWLSRKEFVNTKNMRTKKGR